jgi:hypothetical protein
MSEHQGPGHAVLTLTLSGPGENGGLWHQAWAVCECTTVLMREDLGPPQLESFATAEAAARARRLVMNDPGRVHLLEQEP